MDMSDDNSLPNPGVAIQGVMFSLHTTCTGSGFINAVLFAQLHLTLSSSQNLHTLQLWPR